MKTADDASAAAAWQALKEVAAHPKQEWWGDSGILIVWFNENGKVIAKDFVSLPVREESIIDKLRRWVRAYALKSTTALGAKR